MFSSAESALQDIYKYIKFENFHEGDEPKLSSCNGSCEIILEWKGAEIDSNEFVYIMKTKGYIDPYDFFVCIPE